MIEFDLDPQLRNVEADPSQIGQVLLNLTVNARDAMGGAGSLRVATRNDGEYVLLEVADSGEGMDEETRGRIFEPFFTTKEVGAGTGLGLSTVYGIVAQSGGEISVRSAPGEGATFTVRLPAAAGEPVIADGQPAAPARGAERILVVDDERVVRDLLAQMLREQGYDVSVAGSAREARALERSWDLLITDVVMPETDGVKLRTADRRTARALHLRLRPGGARPGDAFFLQKPFSRDDLAQTVRALLDREHETHTAAA